MYWGHDLDLTGSCDVNGHVTIQFPIGHFLFASSDSFSVRRTVQPQYIYVRDDRCNTVA